MHYSDESLSTIRTARIVDASALIIERDGSEVAIAESDLDALIEMLEAFKLEIETEKLIPATRAGWGE
jgi:hypothetical protein